MDLSSLGKAIPSWGAPTLEGFDTTNVQDGQRLKGSNRQFVRFYVKKFTEVQPTKTVTNEKTGEVKVLERKAVDVEREMVEIITPGDKNVVDDFAQDFHKREHWPHYKAFRDGKSAPIGTSVDDAEFISPSIATELRYLGVHTVEQLADSSDVLCNNIANGWELREYARAICKANLENKSLGQVNVLKGELEKSQEVILDMQAQLDQMKGMILNPQGQPVQSETQEVRKRSPRRPKNIEVG